MGAGIAGAACARELGAAGHEVTVLERARTPGGRMASRLLDGRPVDLGASYLTASGPPFQAVVDDWVARRLARPWTDTFSTATPEGLEGSKAGPLRYGAPGGLRSLVEDLARGLDVRTGTEVARVGPGPVVDGETYDAVVLAMPDPQARRLLDPALQGLAQREYEPVLALAARLDRRDWTFDGVFVNGDDVLAWVADDGSRRGDAAPVLVAHSTAAFAAQHLEDPAAAEPALVAALRRVLRVGAPTSTFVQRWTYAKPVGERADPYGLVEGVGLCGDGWGASKVEAAWESGYRLGRALA